VSTGQARFEIECHGGELDEAIAAAIADAALARVAARLQIDVSSLHHIRVIVAHGANTVVDREIRVAPRASGRGYSVYDWFELLFTHELTHLLVRDAWGVPPVLWWEGLPVHIGDDSARTRLFGSSYHGYCRALDELGSLIPLEPLLRASTYYRRRTDPRVDLQAGSFCGFLLEIYGPQRLGRFIAEWSRPISKHAVTIIDPLLQHHLGDDLHRLGMAWRHFLRMRVACDPSLVERLRERRFGDAPDGTDHCDDCFAPLGSVVGCPSCTRHERG